LCGEKLRRRTNGEKAGFCLLEWRNLVCGIMVMVVPGSLGAQTTDRALLHTDGTTWLNGILAPETSAIFPDTLIQTQKGHSSTIDADGTSVLVPEETVVQFEEDELVLDHGGLQLSTARQFRVRVNCMTVIPTSADRTRYDVVDIDGKVRVRAYQSDVKIHYKESAPHNAKQSRNSDAIVHEGEEVTRSERCAVAADPAGAIDAKGAILNGLWAKSAAGVAIAVGVCLVICRADDPVSPSKP
jgi:hypothetical protein